VVFLIARAAIVTAVLHSPPRSLRPLRAFRKFRFGSGSGFFLLRPEVIQPQFSKPTLTTILPVPLSALPYLADGDGEESEEEAIWDNDFVRVVPRRLDALPRLKAGRARGIAGTLRADRSRWIAKGRASRSRPETCANAGPDGLTAEATIRQRRPLANTRRINCLAGSLMIEWE
jgi:hypothetical protein